MLLNIFCGNHDIFFYRTKKLEQKKLHSNRKTEILSNIIHVFTVTIYQFNASLLEVLRKRKKRMVVEILLIIPEHLLFCADSMSSVMWIHNSWFRSKSWRSSQLFGSSTNISISEETNTQRLSAETATASVLRLVQIRFDQCNHLIILHLLLIRLLLM